MTPDSLYSCTRSCRHPSIPPPMPALLPLLLAGLLAGGTAAGERPKAGSPQQQKVYVPPLTAPTHLVVACLWAAPEQLRLDPNTTLARAEVAMLGSLAGLLLRHRAPFGLYLETNSDARLVLQQLKQRRGVSYKYAVNGSTAFSVAKQLASFAGNLSSFVLYDAMANQQSTNVARMQASLHNALMVDQSVAAAALQAGFSQAVDVSNLDDSWALTNLLPTWPLSKAVALEQSNSLASNDMDRVNDIATAFGAIAFGDVGSGSSPGPHRDAFLSAMDSQGLVFGWPSYNEVDSVPDVSAHDKLYVVCEMSANLALLSSFSRNVSAADPLKQRGRNSAATAGSLPRPDPTKHYVTFHFTDGDNIEWIDGEHPGFEFYSAGKFWDASGRGSLPLAWGLPTLISDLSAPVMEMLYETATVPLAGSGTGNRSTGADVFVAVSPVGYGCASPPRLPRSLLLSCCDACMPTRVCLCVCVSVRRRRLQILTRHASSQRHPARSTDGST